MTRRDFLKLAMVGAGVYGVEYGITKFADHFIGNEFSDADKFSQLQYIIDRVQNYNPKEINGQDLYGAFIYNYVRNGGLVPLFNQSFADDLGHSNGLKAFRESNGTVDLHLNWKDNGRQITKNGVLGPLSGRSEISIQPVYEAFTGEYQGYTITKTINRGQNNGVELSVTPSPEEIIEFFNLYNSASSHTEFTLSSIRRTVTTKNGIYYRIDEITGVTTKATADFDAQFDYSAKIMNLSHGTQLDGVEILVNNKQGRSVIYENESLSRPLIEDFFAATPESTGWIYQALLTQGN